MKSTSLSSLKSCDPGTLYAVVEPSERKSVTARELAATTAVPESAVDAMVPEDVVAYVKVVVVGTDTIVRVPLRAELVRPATTTESPTANACAVDVVIVAVVPVRATFETVFEISPCHV
jgi:hypothetical protein